MGGGPAWKNCWNKGDEAGKASDESRPATVHEREPECVSELGGKLFRYPELCKTSMVA